MRLNPRDILVDPEFRVLVDNTSWHTDSKGYVIGWFDSQNTFLHKIIRQDITGQVDHKNGNKLDNRKSNLRPATNQQNSCNRVVVNKKSGLPKGVVKRGSLFGAQIGHNKSTINLGSYVTIGEAERVYKEAAERYQGEFAVHKSR